MPSKNSRFFCSMRLNLVRVRNPIMNFENTTLQVSNKSLSNKSWRVKGAVLSLSLLLGACASTGDKVESAEPAVPVQKSTQAQPQEKAPTAAELMKTLKAPLVEPPAQEKKVVQRKTVQAQVEKKVEKVEKVPEKVMVAEAVKAETVKVEAVVEAKVEKIVAAPAAQITQSEPVSAGKVSAVNATPFNVSVSKLPFNYDIWTIKKGNTPLTKGLVIMTPTWEMGKEGYTSQIWFTMMEDQIHVNSSSDIETASKGLGIRIDGGDLIPFTEIAEKNIGVISGKWLNHLAAANKVNVYLGFFPGKKPTSETFTSDLSLDNLARIVATYRVLNQ